MDCDDRKGHVFIDKDSESENERKVKELLLSLDAAEEAQHESAELTENEKLMAIPQLEISTEPKSTANITNLTDEELKLNPELYKMYSYYIPFAGGANNLTPPNPPQSAAGVMPRDDQATIKRKSPSKKQRHSKLTEPYIAPSHTNVQSVISPNGGIYHPCHGYSTREISIFDLFPGIVKYQSKRFGEADRIKFLLAQSQKPFCGVNGRPLGVDESEMWFTALKYLFNDITLGQFEYMTEEMQFLIKQYLSTHQKRRVFLTSIIRYGFLRVVSDLRKKLPRQEIKQQLEWEKRRKQKINA